MKIGDEVYIHGYVDEIRKDIVIIRNEGGYFGTVKDEIVQEQKTEWIPVSERLPEEEHGEYFITWITSMSKRPLIAICEGEVTSEYGFEWILDSYINNYPDVAVIAWMPLPEPYRAESEDT